MTAFMAQALLDTEAALLRLFRALPSTEFIAVKVLDAAGDWPIIEGTVSRADVEVMAAQQNRSIRMRLRRLGLRDYPTARIEGMVMSI